MGYRLFRDQNTVVLEQGTLVTEFPIVDSYFGLNAGATSYNIKSVVSQKSASITRASISTYSNELGVLYDEPMLLSFLRLYCSLTDKIPAPEPVTPLPILPSGTYIPKNSVSGPFDLLWENQTSNVITTDGSIENTVPNGSFSESGSFKIDHFGDFELKFKFTGDNTVTGLTYFKDTALVNHSAGIEHSVILQSGFLFVYGNAYTHFSTASTIADDYSISRNADVISYNKNGISFYTQTVDFVTGFSFNCAMQNAETIYDIEVIIP